MLKVIDAPWFKIIDGTGAFSTASAKLLRNRRFRSNYLGHAQLSPFPLPQRILLPFKACDFKPLRFSCSTSGRTMRNPANVASACHQMLWGRSRSWTLHLGFDPAAPCCGACRHRPPTTRRGPHKGIPRHRTGRLVRAPASCRRGITCRHRRRTVCGRQLCTGRGTIRPRCRACRAGPRDWASSCRPCDRLRRCCRSTRRTRRACAGSSPKE